MHASLLLGPPFLLFDWYSHTPPIIPPRAITPTHHHHHHHHRPPRLISHSGLECGLRSHGLEKKGERGTGGSGGLFLLLLERKYFGFRTVLFNNYEERGLGQRERGVGDREREREGERERERERERASRSMKNTIFRWKGKMSRGGDQLMAELSIWATAGDEGGAAGGLGWGNLHCDITFSVSEMGRDASWVS